MAVLYHVSGWQALAASEVGSSFVLHPGTQCAEGVGVYFSEGAPRLSAAEGAKGCPSAIIAIEANESHGWWQSKGGKAQKFGKPRTWHSEKKSIFATVQQMETISIEGRLCRLLKCAWDWL